MTSKPDPISLLGLSPEVKILSVEDCPSQNRITLDVEFEPEEQVCPRCGSHHCVLKDTGQTRAIRHLPSAGRSVFIRFTPRRFACEDCRAVFKESVSWIHKRLQMTDALFAEISLRLTENVSIRSIANREYVTPCVVKDVLDLAAAGKPAELPVALCMFDFRAKVGTWDSDIHHWDSYAYLCGIADGTTGVLLDILPGADIACLSDYFGSYTISQLSRVRLVICGMNGIFISVARKFFPSAVTGIEPCCMSGCLNAAMDRIRMRALSNPAGQEPGQSAENQLSLRETARFLRIRPSSGEIPVPHNANAQERLSRVLEVFPDISEMYTLLTEFGAIITSDWPGTVRQDLNKWLEHASSSSVPEIRDAASTVRHWRGYLLDGLEFRDHCICCMELMGTIRAFMRVSGCSHSFEAMRNRLLLICGTVHPASPAGGGRGFHPSCGGES
ncbi:MAG: transposase [Lachnospiraceae bacterium]|nr:transposase [Lachnospiraceae bacterium]